MSENPLDTYCQSYEALQDAGLVDERDSEKCICSWDDFMRTVQQEFNPTGDVTWAFRGQGAWKDRLETTIEKRARQHGIALPDLYYEGIEQGTIRRFKREYQKYSAYTPDPRDHVEWMATMQHHGAPTRLLDVTYSVFVALYFALWDYEPGKEEAALWCFNVSWLQAGWDGLATAEYQRVLQRDSERRNLKTFDVVLRDTRPKIYSLNPYYLPERLVLQQAAFLMPTDIGTPFVNNLAHMPKDPPAYSSTMGSPLRVVKVKIHLDRRELEKVRGWLRRMNINNATLFPGKDGFAKSIRDRLPFKEERDAAKWGF